MAAKDDPRFKHVAKMVAGQLSTAELPVSAAMVDKGSNATWVQEFLAAGAEGVEPRMALLFYLQPKEGSGEATVFMATPESDQLTGKCCYVVRLSDPFQVLPTKDLEDNLNFGTLAGNGAALHTLMRLTADLYKPLIDTNTFQFKKKMADDNMDVLQSATQSFCKTLEKGIESLEMSMTLPKPEKIKIENRPAAIAAAAANPEIVDAFEECVSEWADITTKLLDEQADASNDDDDIGPRTELAWWRKRATKLNSICDDLRGEECQQIMLVLQTCKSRKFKIWRQKNNAITDALNEAKDNVKYLSTLDKYIEPLYSASPPEVIESLSGLLNNLRMMHAIARYYATPERMTMLFGKITEQMIVNCRAWVTNAGSLWEQDTAALLDRLQTCHKLFQHYREQYESTRDKLRENPSAKQFEFSENIIFSKSNLFQRRVEKLIDLFTTVDQFSTLSNHNLEGMEGLMANFFAMVADFKRKPYDLFDFQVNQFDRDYLEFLANIHELESSLQGFINSSFEHITSTEAAMTLLDQLRHMLQRDSLKDDLESKRLTIFQHFLGDLEVVSRTYEKLKNNPPLVRNVPPVTGNVLWARQLMRRIESPMQQFRNHQELMDLKDSKKAVKVYNKIARTVVEFEALWELAWVRGIEAAKSGLQSTLIVRHPTTDKLYVNFDHQILELMKEAKCLRRLGHEIPESAKMVLMMEDKYKHHYNLLSYALAEYERVMESVPDILAALLKPHMAELQCVINPGLVTLTWTSMNIQAYLQRFHAEMVRFGELVDKLKDNVANRLVRNQNVIKNLPLVEMPEEGTELSLDKFVAIQEKFAKEQTAVMFSKNIEVEAAMRDLVKQITEYELSYVPQQFDQQDINNLADHFSKTTYRAVLDCTRASLEMIKGRVASRSLANFLFIDSPIFEVNVEMTNQGAMMNPTLGEIQNAINASARAVLSCSKALSVWQNDDGYAASKRVFDVISRDKEVVRVVLLLTGSIEGVKRQVHEYIHTFVKYDYLWRDDKKAAYEAFMSNSPSLEDFEAELKKYDLVEQEIMRIPEKHNIGALSLDTTPLKTSLSLEARTWKKQYARNLHEQAKVELDTITSWIETHKRYLSLKIADLDDVRNVMGYLAAIREKETMLDWEFGPVEEKYTMLAKYNVEVPKDENDMVTDLMFSWKKLKKEADLITDRLCEQQAEFRKDLVRNVRMFVVDVAQFRSDFEANGPGVPGLPPMDANERLLKFKRLFEERERKWMAYVAGENLFGLPTTQYPELEKTKEELQLLDKLYGLYSTVLATVNEFNEMAWGDVCGFTETPKGPESNISGMVKKLEEFQLACKKMPKELRGWDAYIELKKTVDDFLETLPLIEQLANPALRPRHWKALEELTGCTLNIQADNFKLSTLLDAGILPIAEDVEEIAGSAVKELAIEGKLKAIEDDWVVRNLTFAPFKQRGNIILNTGATFEMMEVLEESQMGLGSMLASRFVIPFKDYANEWVEKLSNVGEILEQWTTVQAMWQYLEAVFTSGDIAKQLPQESKRFQGIDKNWVKIMTKGNEAPNVINYIYGNDVLKQLLPHMIEQLELCQKALTGYLDQKRAAFPRFFFVADATLLEVLSQGSNPQAIQPHLQSCFDSVVYAEFGKKDYANCIEMLQSGDGQTIKLVTRVKAEGNIEEWLDRLLKEMQNTVNRVISYAASDCEVMDTVTLTHKYQAQVSLIAIQFKWTTDSEDALYRAKAEKGIVRATNKKHQQRLNDLVSINMSSDQELAQYGGWTRKKVETMIIVDVHQRDVFVDIEAHRVKDPEDFEWQKQARCYWNFDDDVAQVSVADVDFPYTNEYLGVKERLCITPLTDRCYVTLSQALGMFLGGAPAGPAGTGKTETTKDMGCTLGKFVMVTNCGDQMDFRSLGGIYKGAAMGEQPSRLVRPGLAPPPNQPPPPTLPSLVSINSSQSTPLTPHPTHSCAQPACGRASTSSTASTSTCSPSPHSRSAASSWRARWAPRCSSSPMARPSTVTRASATSSP
jgi:dynein heavy chain